MLLEPHTRFFLRHELCFRPARNRGLALPLRAPGDTLDAESAIRAAMRKGTAQITLRNEDVVHLTAMDIRPETGVAVFLFRRSDPDAATPVFEHRKTKKIRLADKSEDEALAVSCHLFVSLSEIPNRENPTYRAILEEVPGLGRTYIQQVLHEILRANTYEFEDKHGEVKETYTLPSLLGLKTETVGGAARSSAIPYVELVRPGTVEGLDTEGLLSPREQRMKLVFKTQPADPLPVLQRIKEWALGNNWQDVRVEISMPEDRRRIVSIAREAEAADVLFVRSEQVDVPHRMEQCTDTINEELVAKACEILRKPDRWG